MTDKQLERANGQDLREYCLDEKERIYHRKYEWLITNGIGGYATGTISGELTRSYQGLLIAALKPPLQRTLLVAKLDETVHFAGRSIAIHANRWNNGQEGSSPGARLAGFCLEGTIPVWKYQIGTALLEKRIWMQHGENTTYISYQVVKNEQPLRIACDVLVNDRSHHQVTRGKQDGYELRVVQQGLEIITTSGQVIYLLGKFDHCEPVQRWVRGFYLEVENERGLPDLDDHYLVAKVEKELTQGDSFTIIATCKADTDTDASRALQRHLNYEKNLIKLAGLPSNLPDLSGTQTTRINQHIKQLVLAADQFIVQRPTPADSDGMTVIAGYPWFSDWGRDTMISLPGLTLATGRPEIARKILLTSAQFIDQGMLPNRFPSADTEPEYNTVDATLWYFQATNAYFRKTGDVELLEMLFPILVEIIKRHQNGTRHQIIVDPQDGLLSAGEEGVQLTWMDAKVANWVVTPRIGKPVEINALWYNALCIMQKFANLLGAADQHYFHDLAVLTRTSFQRFWNPVAGYCYDVIDGPAGDDDSLRPNQLLAISLPHSSLDIQQARRILEICSQKLLTPFGLRSLSPDHSSYTGIYQGDRRQRDAAYHQGTVWGWLIGPYVSALLRCDKDRQYALELLSSLLNQLDSHCVGSVSEIFDGDPPHTPRGCYAQAWTVAEALRCIDEIQNITD